MHLFIEEILRENFEESIVLEIKNNDLINYINDKTVAHDKNAKARASNGALYSIYAVIQDYIQQGFTSPEANYDEYEGAKFSVLLATMRDLPFGRKTQNHYLNNRINSEFRKNYEKSNHIIDHDQQKKRYKINESLLYVDDNNISEVVIQIINKYISLRNSNFEEFRKNIKDLKDKMNIDEVTTFIDENISENADARRFEIISFAILKNYYESFEVWYGETEQEVKSINPQLFKTGRTNANDGGIDFILLPLGKIFQVTETLNFSKYFLDIDKLNKYPLSFVVKIEKDADFVRESIIDSAKVTYTQEEIYNKYIDCIDDIITIEVLREYIDVLHESNKIESVLEDIIREAEVEFNYEVES